MSTGDAYEAVGVVELFRNILSERVASTSRRDTPTTSIIRIRPEEITNRSFVRNFLDSIKGFNLVEGIDTWRKSSMKAENSVVNYSSQR
jgi:hypothetical protein